MNFLRRLALQEKKNLMTARVSMLLKSRASLTCFRVCVLPGRAKDLSAPRYDEPNSRFSLSRERAYGLTVPATTLPLFATIRLHEHSHCSLNFSNSSPSTSYLFPISKPQSKTCDLHSITMPLLKLLFLFYDIGLSVCTSCPPSAVSDTQISHCMPRIAPTPMAGQTLLGQDHPTNTHTHTHTSHSVGLLWTIDQYSTYQQGTTFSRERQPRNPAGFEPVFPASGQPQTPALDRVATVDLYLCSVIP